MIILDIKPYCHECPMFKPTNDVVCGGDTHKDVYVRCTNHIACDIAASHIENFIREENEDDMQRKIGY